MSAEKPQPAQRSVYARIISALMLTGILVFIIPGVDKALGLETGTLSLILLSLAFGVALISFIVGPPNNKSD